MKKAVFKGFASILVVALLICGVLCAAVFGIKQTDAKKEELRRIVIVIAGEFDPLQEHDAQADTLAAMLNGIRVTIIDSKGNVTGDSAADYTTMENHANRPEIMEAKGTANAVSIRQSNTLGARLMYAVIKTADGYYIRLAEEYNGIAANLLSFVPAVSLAALLSLTIAVFLASKFSAGVTGPIADMNNSLNSVIDGGVTLNPDDYPYEELYDMAEKINALAADISLHIGNLKEEKDKTSFILDNMREGLILLGDDQTILLINNSACSYMYCCKDITGRSILHCTRNSEFLRAVNTALSKHQNQAIDINAGGRVIEAGFTVVNQRPGTNKGLIITMIDVTENRNAVKMRRDFFSNASHELKTPITSIKGSAELLCAGVPLDDSQREELLTRIGLESDRLCTLIDDIIMINRIESGEVTGDKELTDLTAIVRECRKEALPLAEQSNLTINEDLEPVSLYASRNSLYELAGNLIMNAVKYNNPGGSVDITLKNIKNEIILTVRNDGEPIPPEHQHRVFERFYRVDKGRSKKAGGTGLGLSIVKHVVDSMNGRITLVSNEKRGTEFSVRLPK